MSDYSSITSAATKLNYFSGEFSNAPLTFFYQLYVFGLDRKEAEGILSRSGNRPGTFILRDASRTPLNLPPPELQSHYSISYWDNTQHQFFHIFVCCDKQKTRWCALMTENSYMYYNSLRELLYALDQIRKTECRNALVIL